MAAWTATIEPKRATIPNSAARTYFLDMKSSSFALECQGSQIVRVLHRTHCQADQSKKALTIQQNIESFAMYRLDSALIRSLSLSCSIQLHSVRGQR